jgi:predicted peroxiredoxin
MSEKTDYSKKSLLVIATHGDEDVERATMAFMCASAASAIGVKTKIFLTGNGVKLAQKNYAEKLPPVEGLASIKELMDAFVGSGGKLQVCIPCRESRGIEKDQFMAGVEFVNLMDFAAQAMETDKIYTC